MSRRPRLLITHVSLHEFVCNSRPRLDVLAALACKGFIEEFETDGHLDARLRLSEADLASVGRQELAADRPGLLTSALARIAIGNRHGFDGVGVATLEVPFQLAGPSASFQTSREHANGDRREAYTNPQGS